MFVTAAVNVGAYSLFVGFIGPMLGIDPTKLGVGHQIAGVALISASHALLNHFGIRLTTLLTDFSGYLILAVAALLTLAMLSHAPHPDFGRLFRFENLSGAGGRRRLARAPEPAGDDAARDPVARLHDHRVRRLGAHLGGDGQRGGERPQGDAPLVAVSGIFGWVMVAAFVLALPSVADGARQGANVFPWLMTSVLPGAAGNALWVGIVAANYLCGLACVTSTSRMMYAFARDGGLPGSRALRRVSPRWKTPVAAIWTTVALAFASTLYAPAYTTLTTACVIFLYLSYVMPAAAGLRAYGRSWKRMGPFDLGGRLYRALAAVSLAGVVLLVWIGVQPPNEKALTVTLAAVALLAAAWWLGVRRRFQGPPAMPARLTAA